MLSQSLHEKIEEALKSVEWGSVEIIVQKNKVTQITVRNISKTDFDVHTDKLQDKKNISNQIVIGLRS